MNKLKRSCLLLLVLFSISCAKEREVKIDSDLAGKWEILKKEIYENNQLIMSNNHGHECSTNKDYYEINVNGTGGEYRYRSTCTATKEHAFELKKTNGSFNIYSGNGEIYIVESFTDGRLKLKCNLSPSTYFILLLNKVT
jgi:uncharacterized secreted protein with C-terminal beta-propeller domain